MDGFEIEVLNRLPLAEAVPTLFRYIANDQVLSEVFDENRGRAYQGCLTFATLVDLVFKALLVHQGSGRTSFAAARESANLDVTDQAAYGKLRRIPVAVSEALLSTVSHRLTDLIPSMEVRSPPACFAAYELIHIDGKKIKKLAKRLKLLRGVTGSLLGGKVLAALNGRTGLAIGMSSALDGEANDAPLVPTLVPQVRARISRLRMWVADRQFCDLTIPHLLSENGDVFVIRHCLKMKFYPDPARPAKTSVDSQGRKLREEWGWVGRVIDKRRMYVRRITLDRPGEESIIVLTNLLDGDEFPAWAIMEVYRERWQIERVFQQVTEVFQLQRLIGSSPQAAIFQSSLCFILYNLIQVMRGYVAKANRVAPETISSEMLFRDVHKQMICYTELVTALVPERVLELPLEAIAVRRRLTELLRGVWSDQWQKSPPKTNYKPTAKTQKVAGGHSSAWKLLETAQGAKRGARRANK
jgi:hypothetical protein